MARRASGKRAAPGGEPVEPVAPAAGPGRDHSHRGRILAAAREAFARLGYAGASVEHIAQRARVSKPTIYVHFGDKAALFVACVQEESRGTRDELLAIFQAPAGELGDQLRRIGEKVVGFITSPGARAIHRVVVAAAAEFPEVGRFFYEAGARSLTTRMARYLDEAVARGTLQAPDTTVAANHLLDLCCGELQRRCQLGVAGVVGRAEIRAAVESGVGAFLRAYAPRSTARRTRPAARRDAPE